MIKKPTNIIPDVTFTNDVNCDVKLKGGCSSLSKIKLPDGSVTKNFLLLSDNIISGKIAFDIYSLLLILYLCIFFPIKKAIGHRRDYALFDNVFMRISGNQLHLPIIEM